MQERCFIYLGLKKRNGFDITVRFYHGAEICETYGLIMLPLREKVHGSQIFRLYRDDNVSVFENKSWSELEKFKSYTKKFKEKMLNLIVNGTCKVNIIQMLP